MAPPLTWEKKGLVFTPKGEGGWMRSHAQVPTALLLPDRIRVFFASRPKQQLSMPGFLDLDIHDPTRVMSVHADKLIDVGAPGSFDQHGVMPSCALMHDNKIWMYYSGWCREVDVPYNNTIGLAETVVGKEWKRLFTGPVVGRTRYDPYNASSPFVMQDNGGWHMWYSSGTGFHKVKDKYEPAYLLRYASSKDGIDWVVDEKYIIEPHSKDEAQTRPAVIRIGDTYHMWFSYRGSEDYRGGKGSYRMGYATSGDGKNWKRDDVGAGIGLSEKGWDSVMIAYPYVIPWTNGRYIMFYNGNDFGRDGFGIAIGAAA